MAAVQGLLVADEGEVRDPRLSPTRVLLRARLADDGTRPSAGSGRRVLQDLLRQRDHDPDGRPRRAAPDLGHPVHALRDVVRPGGEQGAPLRLSRAVRMRPRVPAYAVGTDRTVVVAPWGGSEYRSDCHGG